MGRLTIDITDQQHQALKAMAALQGKTIKEYALERLLPQAGDEDGLAGLRLLLATCAAEAGRGEVSDKSISEIAADVMQSGKAA